MIVASDFLKWMAVFNLQSGGGGGVTNAMLYENALGNKSWSEVLGVSPFSDIRASDILVLARQGSPNISGAGEAGALSSRYTRILVNNAGNNTTGNGSELSPLKNTQGAYDYIAGLGDASLNKQYTICRTGAVTDTDVMFMPFVNIWTDGSPWYVNNINVHPSFETAENVSCWYENLSFASTCTLNLVFADSGSGSGYLNFLNPRTTRVGSAASPTVIFNLGSADNKHHFNFYNPVFSEFNDGDDVRIVCAVGSPAPLSICGGTLPKTINYANSNGGWINLNCVQASGVNTAITLGDLDGFYIQNVMGSYGNIRVTVGIGRVVNDVKYDSSIGAPTTVFTVDGTVNVFTPIADSSAIRSTYSPIYFSYPTPLNFGTNPTIYDAVAGLDLAVAAAATTLQPGYISGFEFVSIGLTVIELGSGVCRDPDNTYSIVSSGNLSADLTQSGAGGLDTGTVLAGVQYYLYTITKTSVGSSSTALVWSANPGTPDTTFDPTYNKFRYLLKFRTQTASPILCTAMVVGNSNERTYYLATSDPAIRVLEAGNETSSAPIAVSPWVSANGRTKAIGFITSFGPGSNPSNVASILSPDFAVAYWQSISDLVAGVTGLLPLNPGGGINYFLLDAAGGAALDLDVSIIQEFI